MSVTYTAAVKNARLNAVTTAIGATGVLDGLRVGQLPQGFSITAKGLSDPALEHIDGIADNPLITGRLRIGLMDVPHLLAQKIFIGGHATI